jgi:hypothetical protein
VERVEENPIRERVRQANSKLEESLSRARGALAGRGNFTVHDIRAASEPLAEVEQIVSRAASLRASDFELDAELKNYTLNLKELHKTLEKVQFMLLARQEHLSRARGHIERVSLWAAALKQTQ